MIPISQGQRQALRVHDSLRISANDSVEVNERRIVVGGREKQQPVNWSPELCRPLSAGLHSAMEFAVSSLERKESHS